MDTIRQKLLFVLLFLNTSLCFADTQPNILVLGDSISAAYGINTDQGWVALLQARLKAQGYAYHVINASISGDTTRTGLNRLKPLLSQHQPQVLIVALGGNDGLRGIAFKEISNSLSKIITTSQAQGSKVLIAGIRLPPNYGIAYNNRFKQVYQELIMRYSTAFVPQLLKDVSEYPHLMQADGIHPAAQAQATILENIWVELQPLVISVRR